MPRRYILTASERVLVAIPTDETALIRLYTLSEQDLSVIKQRRGDANRLGFAVLLCCLRYPGYALPAGEDPPHTFLTMISAQLGVEPAIWAEYPRRNLPAPHSARPDHAAYLAASARAQRQQHRHAARGAPDRIRLERLSPPSFRDSWQGVWSEPDRLHHVRDRREERTSFPIPFPRQRALSLRI